ncbi:MAG: hypothetical protein KKA64_00830 [Nanoarchaeota archaeon]|nr:hypothetical protein [Nanoarchaeota archaeon]
MHYTTKKSYIEPKDYLKEFITRFYDKSALISGEGNYLAIQLSKEMPSELEMLLIQKWDILRKEDYEYHITPKKQIDNKMAG